MRISSVTIGLCGLMSLLMNAAAMGQTGYLPGAFDADTAMLQFHQQQQMYTRQIESLMAEQFNRTDQLTRQVIAEHRQRTGDYQTPDHILREQMMSAYYLRNPQAFQNTLRSNQLAFESMQSAIGQTGDAIRSMNRASDEYYSDTMDYVNRRFDNVNRGMSDFTNTETGQSWNMSSYAPGYSTAGFDTFFQDDSGQSYQVDAFGVGTRLFEDR